jgi:multidrug efflux pump subunit AcrA (membrane-fusion protein)
MLAKGSPVPGKKSRLAAKVAAAVVGTAGACALLAACSTVKVGSAAIVGDQRITTASLDTQVSNLQTTAKQYGSAVRLPAQLPQSVLAWMIRFDIRDQMARDAGITVTDAQIQSALSQLDQSQQASASQSGARYAGLNAVLASAGISPQMARDLGKYEAQEIAFVEKNNGGQLPTSQDAVTKALNQVNASDCRAQKSLGIQVNPQFGQLGYDASNGFYDIVAVGDTLSRPAGQASSPAATPSLPAC